MSEEKINNKFKQWGIIIIASAMGFMMNFDYSSINISLPTIANYFNLKLTTVSWLPIIYLLVVTGFLLTFGKLGDMIGYKKIFVTGIGLYIVGGIFSYFSNSFTTLLLARIFQALGQSVYTPMCIAIITTFLPDNIIGRALGVYSTCLVLGVASGSALGGFITTNYSWRANFLVAVVLALIVFIFSLKMLPEHKSKVQERKMDILGTFLFFIAISALLFFINAFTKMDWHNPILILSLLIAIVAAFLFYIRQKMITYPLLDFALFKNLDFSFALIAAFLIIMLNMGFVFILPFYLQLIQHFDPAKAGFILLIGSIANIIFSPIAGNLSDRVGARKLCILGVFLITTAFLMCAGFKTNSSIGYIISCLICLSIGVSFFLAPNSKLIMGHATFGQHGIASGLYKIALEAGACLGISLFTLVATKVVSFDLAKLQLALNEVMQNHPDIVMLGIRGTFIFAALVSILAIFFAILAKDRK